MKPCYGALCLTPPPMTHSSATPPHVHRLFSLIIRLLAVGLRLDLVAGVVSGKWWDPPPSLWTEGANPSGTEIVPPLFLSFFFIYRKPPPVLFPLISSPKYVFTRSPSREEVPGPPAYASLEVVGSDSIEASFSPPISDGGSSITAYTVRKDSYLFSRTLHLRLVRRHFGFPIYAPTMFKIFFTNFSGVCLVAPSSGRAGQGGWHSGGAADCYSRVSRCERDPGRHNICPRRERGPGHTDVSLPPGGGPDRDGISSPWGEFHRLLLRLCPRAEHYWLRGIHPVFRPDKR